jgi:undecaprenyl-diphosphatase
VIRAGRAAVERFDRTVDDAFDSLRGIPPVDRVLYSLSELGDFSLIWHIASAAIAVGGGERGERRALRLSTALAVESVLVNGVLKSFTRRSRPEIATERPHTLRTPRTSSFPSGHASSAACATVLLCDGAGPVERVAWTTLATLVAASRVHVRIHHASDVVGGVVVGAALGIAVRRRWPLR